MAFGPYSLNRRVKNWYAYRWEKTCLTATEEVQYPKPRSTKKTLPGRDRQTPAAPGQEAFLTPYLTTVRTGTRGNSGFKSVKKYSIPSRKHRKAPQITTKNLVQAFGSKMPGVRVSPLGPYEWGPFFEHFYRKTDLLFSESFATAGLFLFAFFQCSREKTQMLKNYFFAGSEFEHCFFEKYSSSNACGVLYFSVRCGLVSL